MGGRGQVAVACLVLTAFILVLVMVTINVGQMSQVRTETSNAADAGALAGASWMASGQNEGAAVAAKIWDSIHMLQAIYIMPFCPGTDSQEYARVLWESLAGRPIELPPAPPSVPPGTPSAPAPYFRGVADDVMRAGWNLGRREALTAVMNNLIVRWDATAGTYPFPFQVGGNFALAGDFRYIPEQTMSSLVTMWQDRLYAFNIPQETIMFDWSSGDPFTSPLELGQVFQVVRYNFQYPERPPKLMLINLNMRYLQFQSPTWADTSPVFDYVGELVGIKNTWPPYTSPVVDLFRVTRVTLFPTRPLELDANGRKYWDFDLTEVIPQLNDVDIGICDDEINGLVSMPETPARIVQPDWIHDGAGSVRVKVTHEVNNSLGAIADPNWGATIPVWESRFQPVASEARANFTTADVTENGTQRASAQLTSAN